MKFWWIACNKNTERFREDPSFFYRALNPALALADLNSSSEHRHWKRLAAEEIQAGDVVIFHRPTHTLRFRWLFNKIRRRTDHVFADVDDLVFDPELAEHSPAVVNKILPPAKVRKMFSRNASALREFPRIAVSTEPLARHIRRCFPAAKVTVIGNTIPHPWLEIGFPETQTTKVITYFPGTRSHDADFAMIQKVLQMVLAKIPGTILQVTGKLGMDNQPLANRIIRRDRVPFSIYHHEVMRSFVNLAPLQTSPFSQCKSAIKIIEAGFFGIPTVCSSLPDAEKFQGSAAVFCKNESDWKAHLIEILNRDFPTLQERRALRETILRVANPHLAAQKWLNATHENN